MPTAPPASELATILPGSWNVRSTNYPTWLSRERKSPRFTFELISENPLRLRDDLSYFTRDNLEKHIVGADTWRHDAFVYRGKGARRVLPTRWSVIGMNPEATVIVIRFEKSLATPAGIDVLVRESADVDELRSLVARSADQFGLTAEDFASLTWLDPAN